MTKRYRYSGSLTIAITLLDTCDRDGRAQYRCRISRTGAPFAVAPWCEIVGSPAFRSYADDSTQAFDATARAALAFAANDGFDDVDSMAAFGESDYAVSRRRNG